MSRRPRDPFSRTVVRLPERDLAESILHLAAPLLERLGPAPPPDEARAAVGLAIDLWNAQVRASPFWHVQRPKPLAALRKAMCGKGADPGSAATFELLSARWRKEFAIDPRLVDAWSFEVRDGQPRLVCETGLPEGVEAEVPPPAEARIAIGGVYLDEVRIRRSSTSLLGFPVERHRGDVADDGVATVHTQMPTVAQLFAEGRLSPIGGAAVPVAIGGKPLGPMVLVELTCTGQHGWNDVAILVFRPERAGASAAPPRTAAPPR